jgi:hypothetical protein
MSLKRELRTLKDAVRALTKPADGKKYTADPLAFATEALGLALDPWQARVLAGQHHQAILNCSRQSGKSTIAAVVGLHEALYRPRSLTVLVSPSLRQSSELFRKVVDLRESLPWSVSLAEDNRLSMRVRGGGRIVSLPGSERTIRGLSAVTLLIEDEASRIEDSLHFSVMPMLATTRGRLLLMSTPWTKRGVFYNVWQAGEGWHRERVTVHDVPRIGAAWIEEQQRSMPSMWFRCEYLCEFLDAEDGVFQSEDIDAALTDQVRPIFGGQHD